MSDRIAAGICVLLRKRILVASPTSRRLTFTEGTTHLVDVNFIVHRKEHGNTIPKWPHLRNASAANTGADFSY
jgi:hypothetical protein